MSTILKQNRDELCHYGVLGMKWGVRKARKNVTSENKQYKVNDSDVKQYGKRGAARIAKRRSKGDSYAKARRKESIRGIAINSAIIAVSLGLTYRNSSNIRKRVADSYNNVSILDANGNVVKRYHDTIKVGEAVVGQMLSVR